MPENYSEEAALGIFNAGVNALERVMPKKLAVPQIKPSIDSIIRNADQRRVQMGREHVRQPDRGFRSSGFERE